MGRKLTKIAWRLFFLFFGIFVLSVLAINLGLLGYMPSIKELENPTSSIASEVLSADGSLLGKFFYENRSPAAYSEISPNVFNALKATEDARFEDHSGIDGIAIIRAVANFGHKGGGSTITQQLAKNLFPRENVSVFTMPFIKLKEWITAVKLERNLTKNEIITLYLNTVPFGGNIYGIKTAANTFYNKPPKDLTVDEAAVLVGMLKANTLYNPKRNPDKSKARRNTVIDQMLKYDYISPTDASEYKAKPIALNYKAQDHHEGEAPYFRQTVEEEMKKWARSHTKEDGSNYDIFKDGLKIYTTIDTKMQRYAEEAVEEHLRSLQKLFRSQPNIKTGSVWERKNIKNILKSIIERSERYVSGKDEGKSNEALMKEFNTPIAMKVFAYGVPGNTLDTVMSPLDSIKYMRTFLQTGFIAIDPISGEVKAWVGGINHKFFQYDHANMNTKRQVGSTIKPLLYCLALDNGFSPCSSVSTSPQLFAGQRSYYNAGGRGGMMPMTSALAYSINNASLYLLKQVGINNFVDFVKRTGISSNIEKVPSIALGVSDISLYEMIWAYTMFPGRGINTKPIFISRIEDRFGNVVANFVPDQKEIITSDIAYKMVKMMEGVVDKGTAKSLKGRFGLSGEIAGKTGTTNNQADAWFIGYTPQILAGAWVGCDDRFLRFNSTAIGQGSRAALPIWGLFYKKVAADKTLGYSFKSKFEEPKDFNFCATVGSSGSSSGAGSYYEPPADGYENGEDPKETSQALRDSSGQIIEEVPVIPDVINDEWTK